MSNKLDRTNTCYRNRKYKTVLETELNRKEVFAVEIVPDEIVEAAALDRTEVVATGDAIDGVGTVQSFITLS